MFCRWLHDVYILLYTLMISTSVELREGARVDQFTYILEYPHYGLCYFTSASAHLMALCKCCLLLTAVTDCFCDAMLVTLVSTLMMLDICRLRSLDQKFDGYCYGSLNANSCYGFHDIWMHCPSYI